MKPKILIIDDAPEIGIILRSKLKHDYDVSYLDNGEEGLKAIVKERFDLVLLDINMPGVSGLDVFDVLSPLPEMNRPAVIFNSGYDDEATILKCFEIGADDFVSKNSVLTILKKKIASVLHHRQQLHDYQQSHSELNSLVGTTMHQAAMYGQCINLLADIQTADSIETIAKMFFTSMRQLGLNTAICFRDQNEKHYFHQDNYYCSPITQQVFDILEDKGRIYHFDHRTIMNDQSISILFNNLKSQKEDAYGLLIDVLAKLVPAINTRFEAVKNIQQLKTLQSQLNHTIVDVQSAILELQHERTCIIDDINSEIALSFHQLELDESQEEHLSSLVNSVINRYSDNHGFIHISSKLNDIVGSIQIAHKSPKCANDSQNLITPSEQVVELF
jgi:CheY-like chemotaxis protein